MQPRSAAIFAIATVTLAGLLAGTARAQDTAACGASQVSGGDSTAPCFSGVADILGGQRYLLRTDDLNVTGLLAGTYKNIPEYMNDLAPLIGFVKEQTVASSDGCTPASDAPLPFFTRLGRVYDLSYDVAVSSALTDTSVGCSNTFFVIDRDPESQVDDTLHAIGWSDASDPRLAVFDADLDGYDDIFLMDSGSMQFHSPADVHDVRSTMEFRYVLPQPGQPPLSADLTPRGDPVTGDFNGDGAIDIAWLGAALNGDVKVHFASVCPAKDKTVLGTTCSQAFEIILSDTTTDTGQTWKLPENSDEFLPEMRLAAGDYDGRSSEENNILQDELVLLIAYQGDDLEIVATAYDFDSDLTPTARGHLTLPSSEFFVPIKLEVASGQLEWLEGNAKVAVGATSIVETDEYKSGLWLLSFDQDLAISAEHAIETDVIPPGIQGLAIGRFDPPDLSDGALDFDQQIAVLSVQDRCQRGPSPCIKIDVRSDPNSLLGSGFAFPDEPTILKSLGKLAAPLQAGDLQGRSLRLASPEKITIGHSQADTVLGAPPMHVDFVSPDPGADPPVAPTVYNISVFPTTFNTQYKVSSTSKTNITTKSTTSYTYATKASADETISYGIPDLASLKVKAEQSVKNTHDKTVAKQYSGYTSFTSSLTETTEFDDELTYTHYRMNVYSYPVIGQFVCPADTPDCSQAEKLPLHVQFSGVDNVSHNGPAVGALQEWYQPAQEPGNLFSYPGNQQQLVNDQPAQRYKQLAPPPGETVTWTSTATDQSLAQWASGSSEESTAGVVSNHSSDESVSASGSVSIGGFGASADAGYDTSKSTATSTLNSSTTSFDASQGVAFNQTHVLDTPNYSGSTFIFGSTAPEGTIQTDIAPDTDVTGQGPIRVAFTADMLTSDSSDWWLQAYGPGGAGKPDVGLSHPQRWSQENPTDPTPGDERVWFNCPIGYTSSPDSPSCRPSGATPTPATVAGQEGYFYRIKGLFVTPGDSVTGPSTTQARLGDTLTLQARIYNFSLTNMPDDAEVHAAFYAQPWDATGGAFAADPAGSDTFARATYIGEDVLSAIPAFCGGAGSGDSCADSDQRNWAYAKVTWDTATLDSPYTYWVFWVVTWMQEKNGGPLIEEPAEHGLTAIPGTGLNSLVDVPFETYSNNVGFHKQVFALLPPPNADQADVLATGPGQADGAGTVEEPALRVQKLRVKHQRRRRGEPMTVQVKLDSNQPLDDVVVNFYDGDPADDGVLFDAEVIPHVAAEEPVTVAVDLARRDCARRRLYVEAFSISDDAVPAFANTRHAIRPDLRCRKRKD